jgi:hypothetical protein
VEQPAFPPETAPTRYPQKYFQKEEKNRRLKSWYVRTSLITSNTTIHHTFHHVFATVKPGKASKKHSPPQQKKSRNKEQESGVEKQISPLRYAPIEMTWLGEPAPSNAFTRAASACASFGANTFASLSK